MSLPLDEAACCKRSHVKGRAFKLFRWPDVADSSLSRSTVRILLTRTTLSALAMVLLLAGVLKIYGVVVNGDRLLGSTFLAACAIAVEVGVAVVLMVDPNGRRALLTGVGFFTVLALVAWFEAQMGRTNCGCFGPLHVNPWFTLAFDLSVAAVLVALIPRPAAPSDCRGRWSFAKWMSLVHGFNVHTRAVFGLMLLSIAATAVTRGITPTRLPPGKTILRPQEWLGKRVPILDEIDNGDALSRGEWLMVLYRHDCPVCNQELPRFMELAQRRSMTGATGRIAAVELPPYGEDRSVNSTLEPLWYSRLSASSIWFVTTPTVLHLIDGKLCDFRQGKVNRVT